MESENQERLLFSELKEGNSRAFDKIFTNLYPILCRYSQSLVSDQDKAQSLVQNVFVRLWENRFSLGHIESIPSYLTVMVRNESLNYLRHERRNVHDISLLSELKDEKSQEQDLLLSDLTEKLVIALSHLPGRCREAFELSRFENLSNREIAEKMNISVKGVEALITRALKSLRVSLIDFLPSSNKHSLPGMVLWLLFKKN